MAAGIYIHIPFCEGKCPYCDFYSKRGTQQDYDSYCEALLTAINTAPYSLVADSLYFGGGTPSLIGSARLLTLKNAVVNRFCLPTESEITLEANPCSVDYDFLCALQQGGFNRISFGVQSSDDDILKLLGRRHSFIEAAAAIKNAYKAGFLHISADLMLGVPTQTPTQVQRDIANFAALPIDHISAYILKLEANTPFFERYRDIDTDSAEDVAADCYLAAVDGCEQAGFHQYEISNFAKTPADQSRHNLKYWQGEAYLGIGPAAHSFAEGKRFYFPRDSQSFCESEAPWNLTLPDGEGGDDEERIMLLLRLSKGLDCGDFPKHRDDLLLRGGELAGLGLVRLEGENIAMTKKGFLLSNTVTAKLIYG